MKSNTRLQVISDFLCDGWMPPDGPPGPERKAAIEAVKVLVNETEAAIKEAALIPSPDSPLEAVRKLKRMQEIIADIGFDLGHWWKTQHSDKCCQIIDGVNGSRGLMTLVIEWAEEFDTYWEALDEESDARQDYIGEVDSFIHKKIDALWGHKSDVKMSPAEELLQKIVSDADGTNCDGVMVVDQRLIQRAKSLVAQFE